VILIRELFDVLRRLPGAFEGSDRYDPPGPRAYRYNGPQCVMLFPNGTAVAQFATHRVHFKNQEELQALMEQHLGDLSAYYTKPEPKEENDITIDTGKAGSPGPQHRATDA